VDVVEANNSIKIGREREELPVIQYYIIL
jgi:hypothetical protein